MKQQKSRTMKKKAHMQYTKYYMHNADTVISTINKIQAKPKRKSNGIKFSTHGMMMVCNGEMFDSRREEREINDADDYFWLFT